MEFTKKGLVLSEDEAQQLANALTCVQELPSKQLEVPAHFAIALRDDAIQLNRDLSLGINGDASVTVPKNKLELLGYFGEVALSNARQVVGQMCLRDLLGDERVDTNRPEAFRTLALTAEVCEGIRNNAGRSKKRPDKQEEPVITRREFFTPSSWIKTA